MCVSPISIYNREKDETIPVPCSRCPQCTKLRINSWVFRLKQEQKRSINMMFLTLTYNDENLKYAENGKPTLNKKDLQLFFKRLRKAQSKICNDKIKYYAVGEYGTNYGRPHYHVIIFNVHPILNIEQIWGNGIIDISPARPASVKYTLKYISKPKTKQKNDAQLREFALISKKLGENYLTDNIKKYHSYLPNCYLTTEEGFKMPLPKYYKEKLYDDIQRPVVTEIIKKRAIEQNERTLKFLSKKTKNPELLLDIRKLHSKFEKRIQEVF